MERGPSYVLFQMEAPSSQAAVKGKQMEALSYEEASNPESCFTWSQKLWGCGIWVRTSLNRALPSGLPHNIEQSSLLWIALLIIHFKYNSMDMAISNSLAIPFRGWIVDCKSHILQAEQNTRGKRTKKAVSKIIPIYLNVNCDHTLCLVWTLASRLSDYKRY